MHLFALLYSISGLVLATLAAPTPRPGVESVGQEVSASPVAQGIAAPKLGGTLTTEASPYSDTETSGTDVFATVDLRAVERANEDEVNPKVNKSGCVVA
ncbi:hypothetical protein K438DRAFT_1820572 [Mycena galopus ATCC 62051]|nr:hypothetical protein K438DRAFT_1820572 [Mycena galopus ATCC 62051]